jgi:hypothetical protein
MVWGPIRMLQAQPTKMLLSAHLIRDWAMPWIKWLKTSCHF